MDGLAFAQRLRAEVSDCPMVAIVGDIRVGSSGLVEFDAYLLNRARSTFSPPR
jgi:hypothetical protein